MKVKKHNHPTFALELTNEEASFLLGYMQNSRGVPLDQEPPENQAFRLELFNVLKAAGATLS